MRRGFAVLAVLTAGLLIGGTAGATTPAAHSAPGVNSAPTADATGRCEGLAGGRFAGLAGASTQITQATFVAVAEGRRAYCDVAGYVNPAVGFGMYLPADDWNGKFIVRGCGGSCGLVAVALACKSHLRDGYACLITDMGHKSSMTDNNWAANNLQGQIDFGFRATHVATLAGRAITAAFYDKPPRTSYFFGCSTGGRQAMIEAQRFPEDFDGIIAIASATGPLRAADGEAIAAAFDPTTFNFDARGKPILPIRKVPMLHRAVIARCDLNDGVRDGLIGDPRDCHFDPADIQCPHGDARECLTAPQVEVVRKIYRLRGMQPGSELNWINGLIREAAPTQPTDYAQSRGDPSVLPSLYNAANPDLRQFKAHGGKLIAVQGWSDQQIVPTAMIDYYELVTRTMGGVEQTKDFYRQFMVPGMDHCSGGEGAYGINYIAALENWVEGGHAPDQLLGVHPKLGAPLDFFGIDLPFLDPAQIVFTRPHFAYPDKAVYSGSGDPNSAASFVAR